MRSKTVSLTVAALLLLGTGPSAAQVQHTPRAYRIGFVSPTSPGATIQAFQQGLRELGYVEGQNVIVEARFAEGRSERLPGLVDELIKRKVDVLVVGSTLGALAAKRATATVPIVFAGLIDPVAPGIVTSLARPGGNITGATFGIGGAGVAGKYVELLKEAAPEIAHVAALWNSASPHSAPLLREMRIAAQALNVRLDEFDGGNPTKLEAALTAISGSGARGLIVSNDPFFFVQRARLVEFARNKRLIALYFAKDFVDAGGLMAYGPSLTDSYRRAATYVDKILKGAKPADLPIDQPTRFELVISRRTARAFRLTIPQSLLIRADEVID